MTVFIVYVIELFDAARKHNEVILRGAPIDKFFDSATWAGSSEITKIFDKD